MVFIDVQALRRGKKKVQIIMVRGKYTGHWQTNFLPIEEKLVNRYLCLSSDPFFQSISTEITSGIILP